MHTRGTGCTAFFLDLWGYHPGLVRSKESMPSVAVKKFFCPRNTVSIHLSVCFDYRSLSFGPIFKEGDPNVVIIGRPRSFPLSPHDSKRPSASGHEIKEELKMWLYTAHELS